MLAGTGLLLTRLPYMGLVADLASGEIDGSPIPMVAFTPAPFEEKTNAVRCGDLVLDVPLWAKVEPRPWHSLSGVVVELDGLKCLLFAPRHRAEGEDDLRDLFGADDSSGECTIDRRAAICRACAEDLSFWTGPVEVQQLRDRLQARPFYCLRANRVEVVRGKTLSGLLLIWTNEGRPRMVFEYVSHDDQIAGTGLLFADVSSDRVMPAARALLSTFRLESESAAAVPGR